MQAGVLVHSQDVPGLSIGFLAHDRVTLRAVDVLLGMPMLHLLRRQGVRRGRGLLRAQARPERPRAADQVVEHRQRALLWCGVGGLERGDPRPHP